MANINTIAGYNILNKSKIDSRFTVENAGARLAFDAANVYEGLIVFQEDNMALVVHGWVQIMVVVMIAPRRDFGE